MSGRAPIAGLRWLDCTRSGPGSATLVDDLLPHHPNEDLQRHVEILQDAVLRRDTSWNDTALAEALHRVRRARRQREAPARDVRLLALNPR